MKIYIGALVIALLTMVGLAKQNVLSYENNFYVILSTSKFFFNYRHSLNAIIFYQYLKSRGINDDNILLMVPTDHACSSKNAFPGTLYG
jgi:phosphatidylinositol glycan class K